MKKVIIIICLIIPIFSIAQKKIYTDTIKNNYVDSVDKYTAIWRYYTLINNYPLYYSTFKKLQYFENKADSVASVILAIEQKAFIENKYHIKLK